MTAGIVTLELLSEKGFYEDLGHKTKLLAEGLFERADQRGVALSINYVGGMFGFFFTDAQQVVSFEQVTACDIERFNYFFNGMLERGIYLAPSAYEAGFVSAAHTIDDINVTLDKAAEVFAEL